MAIFHSGHPGRNFLQGCCHYLKDGALSLELVHEKNQSFLLHSYIFSTTTWPWPPDFECASFTLINENPSPRDWYHGLFLPGFPGDQGLEKVSGN